MGSYRTTAHVGPFDQGDIVNFDEADPEHAGLLRTGWFELVQQQVSELLPDEYTAVFDTSNVTPPWNLGQGTVVGQEVSSGGDENPGGTGPDLRAERRRKSRRTVRSGDDAAGAEPGAGAGPEGHGQPGE